MEVVPMEGSLRLPADDQTGEASLRRIGTRVIDKDAGCAVFHPDLGMSIVHHSLWTKGNLKATVEMLLDHPEYDIAGLFVGRNQLDTYLWVNSERFFATVKATID